ncbi:signal peptidase II [Actinomadura nitritigenes]|uniref:signal peptidase II n=1 Tax=Actinomadura nitritigenes TaxID=134602 RepID=UPI003D8AB64B
MRPKISAQGLLALVTLVGIAADQITKALAVADLEGKAPRHILGDGLPLDVYRNSGGAFSFAPMATLLFSAIAVSVAVVIARQASTLRSSAWAVGPWRLA